MCYFVVEVRELKDDGKGNTSIVFFKDGRDALQLLRHHPGNTCCKFLGVVDSYIEA